MRRLSRAAEESAAVIRLFERHHQGISGLLKAADVVQSAFHNNNKALVDMQRQAEAIQRAFQTSNAIVDISRHAEAMQSAFRNCNPLVEVQRQAEAITRAMDAAFRPSTGAIETLSAQIAHTVEPSTSPVSGATFKSDCRRGVDQTKSL